MTQELSPFTGIDRPIRYEELRAYNIVSVPNMVHQAMYDMAAQKGYSEESKMQVLCLLEQFIEEAYPTMVMAASVELSNEEAIAMQYKVTGIIFGVYVKLSPKNNAEGIRNTAILALPTPS